MIKKLPSNLINQIAAGEVVDDPKSIIKELLENSIDANSKNIEIILHDGGLSKIIINDDGIGISKSDLTHQDSRVLKKIVKMKIGKIPFIFSSHTKNGIDNLISELFNQCKK